MSLNKIMLIGHLGDDVKLHHFEGGGCIGRFPLATNETYTKKDTNEKVSETTWHNIVIRNKQAETLEKYIKKGDEVYIEGKIKNRKWTDKDGVERYSTEIHADSFSFLSGKSNSQQPSQQAEPETKTDNKSGNGYSDNGNDEDLPF